jgi:hypothetical protein
MTDEIETGQLLRIVIALMGRINFPEDKLRDIIVPTARSSKHLEAYNLCDGTRTRSEVSKAVGLDKDNFSKVVKEWINLGVVYELKIGTEIKLLHLYPLGDAS